MTLKEINSGLCSAAIVLCVLSFAAAYLGFIFKLLGICFHWGWQLL